MSFHFQIIFNLCALIANLAVIQHAYYMREVSWYILVWTIDLVLLVWTLFVYGLVLKSLFKKEIKK